MVRYEQANTDPKSNGGGHKKNVQLRSSAQKETINYRGNRAVVKASFGGKAESDELPAMRSWSESARIERIYRSLKSLPETKMKSYVFRLINIPSENTLYPTNFKTGRRFLSKKGAEFQKYTLGEYREAGLPVFVAEKALVIEIWAHWRDKRRRDMMNYHKALADSLKNGGFIEDDWYVVMRDQQFFYPDHPRWSGIPKSNVFIVRISQEEI